MENIIWRFNKKKNWISKILYTRIMYANSSFSLCCFKSFKSVSLL